MAEQNRNLQPLPPLKAGVEAVQIQHDGQPMILLRDQEGIVEKPVAVSLPAFLIASLLDGRATASDITKVFTQMTKAVLTEKEINALVRQLDQAGFVETDSLQRKRTDILKAFHESPVRKGFHMKNGFPNDRLELAQFFGKFFKDPKGPGKEIKSEPAEKVAPVGLISPHIDFFRGGPAYAWSYQALSEFAVPDVIVSVGVAHMGPNSPWIFTKKSYETPYGLMEVDPDLYRDLTASLWYDPLSDEWAHRTEHSLEFQAVFLKYIWREKAPKWVPILCSSFERFASDRPPSGIETVEKTLRQFGDVLKNRSVLILAGIDLGHVGPRFGDRETLGLDLEKKLETEDRDSLEHAWNVEADALYMSVLQNGHWRKWCGLSALYTSLRLIKAIAPAAKGRMLSYGQAPDPAGGLVSFTSGIFLR